MDRFGSIEGGALEESGMRPELARLRRIAELVGCGVDDLTGADPHSAQPMAQAGELLRLWLTLSDKTDRQAVLSLARSLSRN